MALARLLEEPPYANLAVAADKAIEPLTVPEEGWLRPVRKGGSCDRLRTPQLRKVILLAKQKRVKCFMPWYELYELP